MLLQCSYSCKFPASSIFLSADWRWRYPVVAESCTHPGKRDRCFLPPIAERQRLPNVGNFPHSAFARGPHSPAFEERMRAAMDATGERSAGRPPYPVWHVYWFLSISTRDIKPCNNLHLSFFTADDNHLQKSTVLSSVMCRYAGHQQSLHQPKFDHFFWKFDRELRKSYGSFALKGCYSLTLLITHFISFEVQRRLSKLQS